jgi:Putative 2OG-Fe(II) oxygenase
MPIGGRKIRDVPRWGISAADLVHARAKAFFSLASGNPKPTVDACWASISRHGDYLSPHSHDAATGSLVYSLDPGDEDPDNPLNGRLSFADPRIAACCPRDPRCVTMEVSPEMKAGTLAVFPSQMVQFVHTYTGQRPRITIARNMR